MSNFMTIATGATHQLYDVMLGVTRRRGTADENAERDRGAVSLEQVLWFAAAGLAVAVIAGIIFQRITNEAEENNIVRPGAPSTSPSP